jgi:alkanesulfonate monooxygenase SsuD/methylene tetrahydromethanopterin reductase-like flavin-dependent oxidoreductase (luciferase family)
VPVGVLVSGAGYREAGLLVKMATALDHLAGGRAALGLGAGWHERDHAAFGFPLPPVRERLDRLDEQSAAIRALLDGSTVTTEGAWVTMDRAVNDPPPIGRLPLMIGGSGERRTLRIVARDADAWNGEGDPETWGRRSLVLDQHCRDLGRDPRAIRRTVGVPPVHVRATTVDAHRSLAAILERNGLPPAEALEAAEADPLADTIGGVLRVLEAYATVGAHEVIADWPAPFDDETLRWLADAGATAPSDDD